MICSLSLGTSGLRAASVDEALMAALEKASQGDIAVGKLDGLSLSPFCGPEKKREIGESWSRLATILPKGLTGVVVAFSKEDGDLAAGVVSVPGDLGEKDLQLFAFGLKMKDGAWKVAPVMASFENAGLGFSDEIERRAGELEDWMLNKLVTGGKELRERAQKMFRARLEKKISGDELKTLPPDQVMVKFLKAAQAADHESLLVWMGLLEESEDVDWDRAASVVTNGVKNEDRRGVWHLLHGASSTPIILESEGDEEDHWVYVGFVDPFVKNEWRVKEKIRVFQFTLTNSDKQGWRVKLPSYFMFADADQRTHRRAFWEEHDHVDEEMENVYVQKFEKKYAGLSDGDPEKLLEKLAKELGEGSLVEFLRYLDRRTIEKKAKKKKEGEEEGEAEEEDEELGEEELEGAGVAAGDADGPGKVRIDGYRDLAAIWRTARKQKGSGIRVVKVWVEGDFALGVVQKLDPVDLSRVKFLSVKMIRDGEVWRLAPLQKELANYFEDEKSQEALKNLTAKYSKGRDDMETEALGDLLNDAGIFTGETKVSPEEALKSARTYRAALRKGDLMGAVKESAIIKDLNKPMTLLKLVGGAIKGARSAKEDDQELGVVTAGGWVGVSLLTDTGGGKDVDAPVLVVVPTKDGPRVLLDAELWATTGKAKKLLNEDTYETLAKSLEKEEVEGLKKLVETHDEKAIPAWKKWQDEWRVRQK